MAVTQRPVEELEFSEPSAAPAWKASPTWAVVATGDKAAGTDVIRSMAERAGATITEADGSHVIMVSQPETPRENPDEYLSSRAGRRRRGAIRDRRA
jgi:hypothetical protein